MSKEIVKLAEYVCDHICPMPEKMFYQEKMKVQAQKSIVLRKSTEM